MHSASLQCLAAIAFPLVALACSSATAAPGELTSGSISDAVSTQDAGVFCEEPGRFVVRGDVVLDTASDGSLLDWQRDVSPSAYSQPEAVAYCDSLRLDGTGWHLPTVDELASLVLHPIGLGASTTGTCVPSIDQVAFPATPADDFWTSTSSQVGQAMYTGFYDGRSHLASFDTPMSVRCVRAAPSNL
jgi:hypothetical protein